ncbi:unnamed protein product [Paramecium octaurelia]|uniref:Transmembrane protein n=1 Tax=Paramecium octaurelia TaxID=43137 RepID=A0A8S1TFI8_PAROT|nr:unnamed protein product [Paramecium octaurelia]
MNILNDQQSHAIILDPGQHTQFLFISKFTTKRKPQIKHKFLNRLDINFTIINLVCLLIFYFSLVYSKEYPSEELYDQFIFNQNQGIIEDIIFLNSSIRCPSQYESLFNYNWPGTYVGCDCTQKLSPQEISSQAIFTENFKKQRQCEQSELQRGCKTVFEIKEKSLILLNDNNYSKPFLLCAKRNYNISLRFNFTYCQLENKTICGSGEQTYCLPPEVECPISEIGFTTNFDSMNSNFKNNTKLGKSFNVSNRLQFYYTKNQTYMPISQVQITETDGVCKLNSQNNISPNRSDYYLMKIQRKNCQENDTQFKIVNRISEDQFYLANNLLYLNRSLSYFKTNSSIIWSLQTKSYTQIRDNCQYGSEDRISQYEQFLRKIDLQGYRNLRYVTSFLIIPILLLIIKLFQTEIEDIEISKLRKIERSQIIVLLVLRFVKLSIHFSIFAIGLNYDLKLNQYIEYFTDFISSQCIVTELASNIYDFEQLSDSFLFRICFILLLYVAQICQGVYFLWQIWKIIPICRDDILPKNKVLPEPESFVEPQNENSNQQNPTNLSKNSQCKDNPSQSEQESPLKLNQD